MKEDVWLIGIVFAVWAILSLLYFTVPVIYMPTTGRVWVLGAVLFLILTVAVAVAQGKGRDRKRR